MVNDRKKKRLHLYGLFHRGFPAEMQDADIRLRRLRFSDRNFMMHGLRDAEVLESCGMAQPIDASWLSLWWWIKKRFAPAYCIEWKRRPIGFIGLYDLVPDENAEISLMIFDPTCRGKRIGSRSLKLLAGQIRTRALIRELRATVMKNNQRALLFWERQGFSKRVGMTEVSTTLAMEICVDGDVSSS